MANQLAELSEQSQQEVFTILMSHPVVVIVFSGLLVAGFGRQAVAEGGQHHLGPARHGLRGPAAPGHQGAGRQVREVNRTGK